MKQKKKTGRQCWNINWKSEWENNNDKQLWSIASWVGKLSLKAIVYEKLVIVEQKNNKK